MPDNDQIQNNIPENPNVAQGTAEQKPVEVPREILGAQPAPLPSNDDNQAQAVAANLQNIQPQPSVQSGNNTVTTGPQPGTVKNSEPYIKAAENIIKKDENDPYKEEVDHEEVQIQYLHDRFGKDIKKENG